MLLKTRCVSALNNSLSGNVHEVAWIAKVNIGYHIYYIFICKGGGGLHNIYFNVDFT